MQTYSKYEEQQNQMKSNIIHFVDYLYINNLSFIVVMDMVRGIDPTQPRPKDLPYISPSQYQEYDNITIKESLDFLKSHPELKRDVLVELETHYENEPLLILSVAYQLYPQLRQEIDEIYKNITFKFLWNNYEVFQQVVLLPPSYF